MITYFFSIWKSDNWPFQQADGLTNSIFIPKPYLMNITHTPIHMYLARQGRNCHKGKKKKKMGFTGIQYLNCNYASHHANLQYRRKLRVKTEKIALPDQIHQCKTTNLNGNHR